MTYEKIALCAACEHGGATNSRLDYALAIFMICYGAFVLHPAASMDGPNFRILLGWGDEPFWGLAILLVGAVQFLANQITGEKRWKPYARMATNYLASITWVIVAMGYGAADPWATAVVNYVLLSLAHVYCAVMAVRDAAKQAMAHHGC